LRNIRVREISLVDSPAVPKARFVLAKRAPGAISRPTPEQAAMTDATLVLNRSLVNLQRDVATVRGQMESQGLLKPKPETAAQTIRRLDHEQRTVLAKAMHNLSQSLRVLSAEIAETKRAIARKSRHGGGTGEGTGQVHVRLPNGRWVAEPKR
jgi:hypothetical protein